MSITPWRVLGYVPDSDEEEEEEVLLDHSRPSAPANIPSHEFNARIAASAVHVVVSRRSEQSINSIRASSSSELSELSSLSSPAELSREASPQPLPKPVQDRRSVSPEQVPLSTFSEPWRYLQTGRSFRPRRSEQLHPYTIEQEKYRQAFRDRGLRPIHIQDAERPANTEADDADEEYSSDDAPQTPLVSAILQSSSPKSASCLPSRGSVILGGHGASSSTNFSSQEHDDELPDLMSILEKRKGVASHLKTPRSVKRRRLARHGLQPDFSVLKHHIDTSIYDFDRSTSPAPVPAASETVHAHHNAFYMPTLAYDNGTKDSHPRSGHALNVVEILDTASQSSSASDDGSESPHSSAASVEIVEDMANRIRGVLPRSFATLDFERQKAASRSSMPHQPAFRSEKPISARGVARPARIHVRANRELHLPSFVESESEPESVGDIQTALNHASSVRAKRVVARRFPPTADPGLRMEDDGVDFMLPAMPRSASTGQVQFDHSRQSARRKKQSPRMMQNQHAEQRKRLGVQREVSGKQRSSFSRKVRQGSSKYANHGVLGEQALADWPNDAPQFLRLVRRQVRKSAVYAKSGQPIGELRAGSRQGSRGQHASPSDLPRLQRPVLLDTRAPRIHVSMRPYKDTEMTGLDLHPVLASPGKSTVPPRPQTFPESDSITRLKTGTQARRKLQSFVRHSARVPIRTAQLQSLEHSKSSRYDPARFSEGLRSIHQQSRRQAFAREIPQTHNGSTLAFLSSTIQAQDEAIAPIDGGIGGKSVPQRRQQQSLLTAKHRRKKPTVRRSGQLAHHTGYKDLFDVQEDMALARHTLRISNEAIALRHDLDRLTLTAGNGDPLAQGTCLNTKSLVGSGSFRKIISFEDRDLLTDMGEHSIWIEGEEYIWGAWNLSTQQHMRQLLQNCLKDFSRFSSVSSSQLDSSAIADIASRLRSIAEANARWLQLRDVHQRHDFANTISQAMIDFVPLTTSVAAVELHRHGANSPAGKVLTSLVMMQMCLCAQAALAADEDVSNSTLRVIDDAADSLLRPILILDEGSAIVATGDVTNVSHAEPVVLAYRLLVRLGRTENFWSIVARILGQHLQNLDSILGLEMVWRGLMTIMPLLDFDDYGIVVARARVHPQTENWGLLRPVIDCIFRMHANVGDRKDAHLHMARYIKIWLHRINVLVATWGWNRSDIIVPVLFDFFARRKFAPLGQDEFLETSVLSMDIVADKAPMIRKRDSPFHVFLKLLALSLRTLEESKMWKASRSLVWRCLPNHGRTYRKEDDLEHADLIALRRQHELLCTLFLAGPLETQDRLVENMRDLVNHEFSHQEVCRVSIKAFWIVTKSVIDHGLSPSTSLVSWFAEMLNACINQLRSARAQIELQYENFDALLRQQVTKKFVQSTIESNQAKVITSLDDLVQGLISLMLSCTEKSQMVSLMRDTRIETIFDLLEEAGSPLAIRRISTVVLELYESLIALPETAAQGDSQASAANDESQDYGDWPEEVTDLSFIRSQLFQRLSLMLESDRRHDDRILISFIHSWARLAASQSNSLQDRWSSFMDDYGEMSWSRLPSTHTKTLCTPAFYASVLELDHGTFSMYRTKFLSSWLNSLVLPTKSFKFQGRLTAAVLAAAPHDPWLQNIALCCGIEIDSRLDNAIVAQRRTDLLAVLFADMRATSVAKADKAVETLLIDQMMQTMKHEYSTLQGDDREKFDYTAFLQHIVSLLQQYMASTCRIDSFFTGQSLFPVPAHDPEYIVAKFKSYGEDRSAGSARRLVSFFRSTYERIILDGQTHNLAMQLEQALAPGNESMKNCSFRSIMLEGIFPTYFEHMLKSPCGWHLALPLLQTTTAVLSTLHYKFDPMTPHCVESAITIIETVLSAICAALDPAVKQPQLLERATVLQLLAAVVVTTTASLVPINMIRRTCGKASLAHQAILYMTSFTVHCLKYVLQRQDSVMIDHVLHAGVGRSVSARHEMVRQYCREDIEPDFSSSWIVEGNEYFWQDRNEARKRVPVVLMTKLEAHKLLITNIEAFHTQLGQLSSWQ